MRLSGSERQRVPAVRASPRDSPALLLGQPGTTDGATERLATAASYAAP